MSSMPGSIASGGVHLNPPIGKGKLRRGPQAPGVSHRETVNEKPDEELEAAVRQVLSKRQVVKPYTPPPGIYVGRAFQTTKPGPKFMVDRGFVDCFSPGSVVTLDDLREYRRVDPEQVRAGKEADIDYQHLIDEGFLLPVVATAQAHEKIETFLPQTPVPVADVTTSSAS